MEKFGEFLIDGARNFSLLNESDFVRYDNFDDYLLKQTGYGKIPFENEAKTFLSQAVNSLKNLEYLPFEDEHIFEESSFYPEGSKFFFYYGNYFCIYNDKSFWYIDKLESYYDDIAAYNRLRNGWQEVNFSKSFFISCKVENLIIFWLDKNFNSFCVPNDKVINYLYKIERNTFKKVLPKRNILNKNLEIFIEYVMNKGSSYFIEENDMLNPFFSTNDINIFLLRLNDIFDNAFSFSYDNFNLIGIKKGINFINMTFSKQELFYKISNLRHTF